MTENGRKISTGGRKVSLGCEGEKIDLAARFSRVASGNIVTLDTLDVGQRYPVTNALRQETQYGPSILLSLPVDPNDVKAYLPKRFTDVFEDSDIELINAGTRSYHLVYHGRYPDGRSYKLTLED